MFLFDLITDGGNWAKPSRSEQRKINLGRGLSDKVTNLKRALEKVKDNIELVRDVEKASSHYSFYLEFKQKLETAQKELDIFEKNSPDIFNWEIAYSFYNGKPFHQSKRQRRESRIEWERQRPKREMREFLKELFFSEDSPIGFFILLAGEVFIAAPTYYFGVAKDAITDYMAQRKKAA